MGPGVRRDDDVERPYAIAEIILPRHALIRQR
jgi:hypothetical protein